MDGFDKHKLLECTPNASIADLTRSYKRLALLHHPDRPNGNKELFQLITKTYRELCTEIKEAELSHSELKDMYRDYSHSSQHSKSGRPTYFNNSQGQLDLNIFNDEFVKHRIDTPDDNGYTEALKKVQFREAPKVGKSAIESGAFNQIFEEHTKQNVNKSMTKYSIPKPVDLCTIPMVMTELGKDTTDFTNIARNDSQISYCDLLKAHTDIRIGGTSAKIKPRTVKQVQAERSKSPPPLSQKELRRIERERIALEREESQRKKTLQERDKRIGLQFYNIMKLAMDKNAV